MGAGTTTISMFAEGHLLSTDVIPVGGHHVTSDLARSLSAPLAEAERIKTLYGKVGKTASDDDEAISYTADAAGASGLLATTNGRVREIVTGRIAGLFGHVAERVERSGVAHLVMRRMVFAGGASQLPGLAEFASEIFARPVRVARLQVSGALPTEFRSPAYATMIGLVHTALDPAAGRRWGEGGLEATGYLSRVGQWLRQSF
jgi:cell division protein FtsA